MAQQHSQEIDNEYIPYKARKLCDEAVRPFSTNQNEFSPHLSSFHSRFFNQYPAPTGLVGGFCPPSTDISEEKDSYESVATISLHNHRIPLQANDASTQQTLGPFSCGGSRTSNYSQLGMWSDQVVPPERSDITQHPRTGNRGRTTYSDEQVAELEDIFSHNPYPTPQARQQLSRDINVPESKIKIWFQNRRARAKKQRGGANAWRSVRSSVQTEQNSNNNNVAANHALTNPKVQTFADKLLAFPVSTTASEVPTKWSKGAATTQSSELGAQSSLSLSGLTICPLANGLNCSSQQTTSFSVSSRTNAGQQRSTNPPNLYYSNHCYVPCYGEDAYNPATNSANQCNNFPSRFPVISSSNEFYQSYTKANATKSTGAFGDHPLNVNTPCRFSHVLAGKSDPGQSSIGLLRQNTSATMPFDSSDGAYLTDRPTNSAGSRQPIRATSLFTSPPPIRRFVFPFKKVLENPSLPSTAAEANNSLVKSSMARNYWCCRTNQPAKPYEISAQHIWPDHAGRYPAMCENTKYATDATNYHQKIPTGCSRPRNSNAAKDLPTGLSQVSANEDFSLHVKMPTAKVQPSKVLAPMDDINRADMATDNAYSYHGEPLATTATQKNAMKVTICTDNVRWGSSSAFDKSAQQPTKTLTPLASFSSGGSDENLCAIDRNKKSPAGNYTNWLKV